MAHLDETSAGARNSIRLVLCHVAETINVSLTCPTMFPSCFHLRGVPEDAPSGQKAKREYRKHGLFTLRHQLIDLGSRAIDGGSSVGVALRKWRDDLIDDLGGKDAISTQQETLVELAARSKIMLDSIGAST